MKLVSALTAAETTPLRIGRYRSRRDSAQALRYQPPINSLYPLQSLSGYLKGAVFFDIFPHSESSLTLKPKLTFLPPSSKISICAIGASKLSIPTYDAI